MKFAVCIGPGCIGTIEESTREKALEKVLGWNGISLKEITEKGQE